MGAAGSWYLTKWWLDYALTVMLFLLSFLCRETISTCLQNADTWGAGFISAALAFTGVVLTAAVFVATMTISSSNPILQSVTTKLNKFLQKNWLAIISLLILSGAGLVMLLGFLNANPSLSVAYGAATLAGVVLSGIRTLKIFSFYLMVEEKYVDLQRAISTADRLRQEAEEEIRKNSPD